MASAIVTIAMGCTMLLACFHTEAYAADRSQSEPASMIIQASPGAALRTELPFDSGMWESRLARADAAHAPGMPVTDQYLQIGGRRYAIDADYRLYDEEKSAVITPDAKLRRQLKGYAVWMRSIHYGELLTWPQAKEVLTMKSRFAVRDLETGLTFHVQRRAGSTHADVQPLTKADTQIMKQIYSGKWTWKRRAILVEKDGRTIAASMHGMPHGGDGIPDNDFDGHFCIHFLGSSTHKTNSVDPDHQTMVQKAAGRLYGYAEHLTPGELISLYFIAINQKDPEVMSALFANRNHPQMSAVQAELAGTSAIKLLSDLPREPDAGILTCDIVVRALIYRPEFRKEERRIVFHMTRSAPFQPWKIGEIRF